MTDFLNQVTVATRLIALNSAIFDVGKVLLTGVVVRSKADNQDVMADSQNEEWNRMADLPTTLLTL